DALLTYENSEHPSVVKGLQYLTDSSSHSANSLAYPAGIGLPKQFYIRYHSYPYVFSLLAVGKYLDSIEKETANET
ncbi:MAG: squalene--hopene cyclase, partial [Bacillota bacterium]|nr:squalene--hopene cyclase [Bacillota bacterium]